MRTKPSPKISKHIDHRLLIRFYKIFKRDPKRIFVRKDFYNNYDTISSHLLVLTKLGLIDAIVVKSYSGRHRTACRNIAGYRFKK